MPFAEPETALSATIAIAGEGMYHRLPATFYELSITYKDVQSLPPRLNDLRALRGHREF
jgi:hypothetical protein